MVALSPLPCLADLYSGSLNAGTDGGIYATGGWASAVTMITWDITTNTRDGSLHYKYMWTTASKNLSHLILEVSDGLRLGYPDYFNGPNPADGDPQTYSPDDPGNSNPGLLGDLFGLKFTPGTETTAFAVEFDSFRLPMWGNFYAKDGTDDKGTVDVYAYNTDFLYEYDAETHPWKIAVPDTAYVPVPGAVLLGMLGLGAAGLRLRRGV